VERVRQPEAKVAMPMVKAAKVRADAHPALEALGAPEALEATSKVRFSDRSTAQRPKATFLNLLLSP
jgi:hypothetical protein